MLRPAPKRPLTFHIDVTDEGTTRGALYKTLHDARKKLRAYVEEEMG